MNQSCVQGQCFRVFALHQPTKKKKRYFSIIYYAEVLLRILLNMIMIMCMHILYTYMCMCVCVFMYMYVYAYVRMCVRDK